MDKSIIDKKHYQNDLITLRELLSNDHFYRIPDYQRGYSWNKEFKTLWNDILRLYRLSEKNRKYYIGMLTLEEIKEDLQSENLLNTSSFYVVDGQQRLTSLIIIIKAIFEYSKNNEISSITNDDTLQFLLFNETKIKRFGYSVKRIDGTDDYFDKRIYDGNKDLSHNNQYLTNINDAANYIEKELNQFDYVDIPKIINIVLDKLVFNVYFITKDFDVRVTFETMNNRGKALTSLELLKNRLMYLSSLFQPNSNYGGMLQNIINRAWKNIYDNLNYQDSQLSDDEYLKAHWIVYKRLNKKKGDAFIEDILQNEFATDTGTFYNLCVDNKYNEAYELLNKYISSLDLYSGYWAFVNYPENSNISISNEELSWIKRLSRLPNNLFIKASIMVVVASKEINKADKIKYYSCLERFVFTNKLLAQDKNDLSFLITKSQEILICDTASTKNKIDDLIGSLENHDLKITKERIEKAIYDFKSYIIDKKNYYYDWNGLKYFLYEFNEYLDVQNASPIEWYKLTSVSIEHVLPQTPIREYWKEAFYNYIGSDNEKKIINSLGNLLLLSSGAENSSLKNYSFPVKKEMTVESKKFAYCDGSRSARKIAENEYWTPKEIYERTNELLKFMYEHWFRLYYGTYDEWKNLIQKADLINFKYKVINQTKYNELTNKLNRIDVSKERIQATSFTNVNNEDNYLVNQLLEYFDRHEYYLRENSKNIQFLANKYTYVFDRNNSNVPIDFKCGVKIDNIKYRFHYNYNSNTVTMDSWIGDYKNYMTYNNLNELPSQIRMFIRSFVRYLRKARNQEYPKGIN